MFLAKVEQVLLFLVIIFLPTQLGRHFWPDFSYIYSLPVDYLSPTIYFWDLLILILLTIWLVGKPAVNSAAINLLFIFLFFQASSVVFADNIGAGLVRIEQILIAGLFGVYLSSKNKKVIKQIWLPLTLSILAESLLAVAQFINHGSMGLWIFGERAFTISTPAIAKFDFYGLEFLRPYGTLSHPNVLAAFLLISILLLPFVSKVLKVVTYILGTMSLLLTVSRTAILATVICGLVVLKGKLRMIILLVLLILSPILVTRYLSLADFDNLTWQRREELLESSIGMLVKSPVFGVGLNNFIPYSSSQIVSGQSRFLQPVHNIFLLELSETGIMGFFGFALLLYFPIKTSFHSRLFLVWVVVLFLGMFDHYFLTLPQGYRLLFLIWGLSLSKNTELD